jgi:hypothetical protein
LGLRCTVESNCSGMFARLASASVTRDRVLDTGEPNCVPEAASHFFISVVHRPLGPWGTWQHQSSPLGEARPRPCDSTGAHLDGEARFETEEHVAAPELSSQRGRAQSHGTRSSVRAYLDREARSEAEEHMTAPEVNSARR